MAAIEFTDSLDTGASTFTPGIGLVNPDFVSPTQTVPNVFVLQSHARLTVPVPPPTLPKLERRALEGVSLEMPTPVIAAGKAYVPEIWGQMTVNGQALAGIGHLRAFPDPDPVWGGASWTIAPPAAPAGATFTRWTAKDLPDPSTYPNQRYLLGSPSSLDGTEGYTADALQWTASAGSNPAPAWHSAYPFKPTVQSHVHFGSDGSVYTEAQGVHFTPDHVAQMWADMGEFLVLPFTVMIVAVITDFPSPNYINYIFDSGQDPTTALSASQMADIYASGVSGDIALSESDLGYRNGMRVSRTQMQTFNDQSPSSRVARVPFTHTTKPKVMAMAFDDGTGKSMSYIRDTSAKHVNSVSLDNPGVPQRDWVMGRVNGLLSPRSACSMVVFEIRIWDKLLTEDQMDGNYDALSSTWKFHEYV